MELSDNSTVLALEQHLATLQLKRAALNAEILQAEQELRAAKEALVSVNCSVGISPSSSTPYRGALFSFDLISQTQRVSRSSTLEEKYRLFHELFSGRLDIHAHRFESAKTGKSGYVPACMNEQDWNLCKRRLAGKDKVRCVDCEHQAFYPISLEVFVAHLAGEAKDCSDVLGAYPLDSNGLCKFILVDFDEEGRKETTTATAKTQQSQAMREAAVAFCETCWNSSVPVYMERSRSGSGLHVWLFFAEWVAAKSARRLITGLLTKAMAESSALTLNSYDMIIPRQDTISKFGFGNLVALPLQGRAGKDRERRGSLFIDEQMEPYPDQWEFLSTLCKLTTSELEQRLKDFASVEELGELVYSEDDESRLIEPWGKRKPEVRLESSDFTGEIEIVRANMLYLPKMQLSLKAANRIRRLASFRNPVFHKNQALRLDTWNIPRVISSCEETERYLCVPRGTEDALVDLLASAQAHYRIVDKTEQGRAIQVRFNGTLRDEQVPAARAMLEHDLGVLSAPTGFGKTVLAAHLIAEKRVSALVLAHNAQLFEQWLEALNSLLIIDDEPPERFTSKGRKKKVEKIGQFKGNKKNTSGLVDVAMIQSLFDRETGEVQDFIKDYGLVIVDECHHVPAASFEPVLKHLNARCLYGLTATPFRDDGHHAIIFLECGPIRYKVDAKAQAEQRPFEHYLVPRFTKLLPSSLRDEKSYSQTLADLAENAERNQLIVGDVSEALRTGRKVLVLTERTEHVFELARLLAGSCEHIITLVGTLSESEKRSANERLATLEPSDSFVVLATGKYVGEGFDCPMLDTLYITMPIAYRGKVAQYTGRLHRLFEGKGDVYVYDYVDLQIPMLEKMYHKRLRGYRDVGYRAVAHEASGQATLDAEVIFNRATYWKRLSDDIRRASRELVITGPRLVDYQVTRLLATCAEPLLNNVIITVVTNPASEYADTHQNAAATNMDRLKDAGIKVVEKQGTHVQCALIDKSIVWYGSINPLGNIMPDDSLLRFTDAEVAEQLLLCAFGEAHA